MTQAAVYGIFGWPVEHSRSPAMHNAAFQATGIAGVYAAFAVAPAHLPDAVAGARALGIAGFNVTLPHKSAIMPLLDAVEPAAQAIGAVNTVVRDGDRLIGDNTDAPGLTRSLRGAGVVLAGKRITVLGAGGAARATVVGMVEAGAAHVTIAARRQAAADAMVASLRPALGQTGTQTTELTALAEVFARTDVLVQATSATLGDAGRADGFAASLPLSSLPEHAAVTDLVYKPRVTSVLRVCQARGLVTVDGLGMLLHQGALAFERWTGARAPLGVMRAAFEREP